jgi:hypothetical protein
LGEMGRSTRALPGTPLGKEAMGARMAAPPFNWMPGPPPAGGALGLLGVFDMGPPS